MIEWVPIKDWVRYDDKPFLILTDNKNEKERVYPVDHEQLMKGCFPYVLFCGEQITHAANLNFPVEKTLEEKVDDYLAEINVVTETKRDIVFNVIKIAKQHYEGEK